MSHLRAVDTKKEWTTLVRYLFLRRVARRLFFVWFFTPAKRQWILKLDNAGSLFLSFRFSTPAPFVGLSDDDVCRLPSDPGHR